MAGCAKYQLTKSLCIYLEITASEMHIAPWTAQTVTDWLNCFCVYRVKCSKALIYRLKFSKAISGLGLGWKISERSSAKSTALRC